MQICNIKEWAPLETKNIRMTLGFKGATCSFEVREFQPQPDDMLDQSWMDNGVRKTHPLPSYALTDMDKIAKQLHEFVGKNFARCLLHFVSDKDFLTWGVFLSAFRQHGDAEVSRYYCT